MADERPSSASIPWPAMLAVVLAVGGAAFYYSSLKSDRPDESANVGPPALGNQTEPARLWQDPFVGIKLTPERILSVDVRSTTGHGWSADVSSPPLRQAANRASLKDQIEGVSSSKATDDKAHCDLLVLAVMVPAEPYAESAEQRIRVRVAVSEALARRGYSPDDAEHIGRENYQWGDADLPQDDKRPNIPGRDVAYPISYEWWSPSVSPFQVQPPDHRATATFGKVVVLWIAEDLMGTAPLRQLGGILSAQGCLPSGPDRQVCVLGPFASTTLRSIVIEALMGVADKAATGALVLEPQRDDALQNVDMWTGTATAPERDLLALTGQSPGGNNLLPALMANYCGARFARATLDDDHLCAAAIEELQLRVAPAGATWSGRVAILSEFDTFYGQSLPAAFDRIAAAQGLKVDYFYYLRGIDGRSPGDEDARAGGAATSAERGVADRTPARLPKSQAPAESPEGTNQSDYLRRLADQIAEMNDKGRNDGSGPVVAVGVLGTDVYDKLMILRALRDRLPGRVFFTTDLDARYLLPNEWRATHNLLCICPFGLNLSPEQQGQLPPFRDCNQTAVFFTALSMLDRLQPAGSPQDLAQRRGGPRRFEVGRRQLFNLTVNDAPAAAGTWQPLRTDPNATPTGPADLLFAGFVVVVAFLPFAIGLAMRSKTAPPPSDAPAPQERSAVSGTADVHADRQNGAATEPAHLPATPDVPPDKTPADGSGDRAETALEVESSRRNRAVAVGAVAVLAIGVGVYCATDRSALSAIAVLALVLIVVLTRAGFAPKPPDRPAVLTWAALVAFTVLGLAMPMLGARLGGPQGVPLSLLGGVSIWPSEGIRLFAIGCCVFLALRSDRERQANDVAIGKLFDLATDDRQSGPAPTSAGGQRGPASGRQSWSWMSLNRWFSPWNVFTQPQPGGLQDPKALNARDAAQEGNVDARKLWAEYTQRARTDVRFAYTLAIATVWFALVCCASYGLGDRQVRPVRGAFAYWVDLAVTLTSLFTASFLVWVALYATYLNRQFIRYLARAETAWLGDVRSKFWHSAQSPGQTRVEVPSAYLDIQLIAARTRVVGEVVYYPFVVLSLLVIAHTGLFADWTWRPGLLVVTLVNLGLATLAPLMLRSAAEDARKVAGAKLEQLQMRAAAGGGGSADLYKLAAAAVRAERRGAFSLLSQHPYLAALLLPSGGFGIWAILEFAMQKFGT